MFSYENGVFFATLLWVFASVIRLVAINSTLERNLNKIGQRLSWANLQPTSLTADDVARSISSKVLRYLFLVAMSIPFLLLSWLSVAFSAGMYIYARSKDSGAPQPIRELRWKMRNIDMSFDEIIKERMKATDQDPSTFERVRNDLINEMKEQGLHTPSAWAAGSYPPGAAPGSNHSRA